MTKMSAYIHVSGEYNLSLWEISSKNKIVYEKKIG